jgi:hypothetical protein
MAPLQREPGQPGSAGPALGPAVVPKPSLQTIRWAEDEPCATWRHG